MPLILIFSAFLYLPGVQGAIRFVEVPASKEFPAAREAGSLRFACAETAEELKEHFEAEGLRFAPKLLRENGKSVCHIRYEPTLRGFRAHPDSAPAKQLFLDLDHRSLLSRRKMVFGDSLDMAKAMLAEIPEQLTVALSVPMKTGVSHYEGALRHYFDEAATRIWLRDRPAETHQTWAQDYLKSGEASGETRVLIPRRVFEGQPQYGEAYSELLRGFNEKTWVRSKLAWEGGDLVFTHDPRDRARLVVFYGDAARQYWGRTLTGAEYGYVLEVEFGADEAVYMGGIAPHVDYFVSFLPEDNIALVATAHQGDREIARSALGLLEESIAKPAPEVVAELRREFETGKPESGAGAERVRALIARARAECDGWGTPVSAEVYGRLMEFAASNCAREASLCVSEEKLPGLIEKQPELFRDWVEFAMTMRTAALMPRALLSIVESQIPGTEIRGQARAEQKIEELRQMGYRVVRVPSMGADLSAEWRWAGISYVNSALVGRTLFVPVFGLGAAEQRLVDGLQRQLGGIYKVAPVYSRYTQLHNGGAHCIVAFIRDPAPNATDQPAEVEQHTEKKWRTGERSASGEALGEELH